MRVLLKRHIELLMFDVKPCAARRGAELACVLWLPMKRSPRTVLVLSVSHKFDFVGGRVPGAVGINHVNQLAVVVLTMDKCHEKAARVFAQYILKNSGADIRVQFFASHALAKIGRASC